MIYSWLTIILCFIYFYHLVFFVIALSWKTKLNPKFFYLIYSSLKNKFKTFFSVLLTLKSIYFSNDSWIVILFVLILRNNFLRIKVLKNHLKIISKTDLKQKRLRKRSSDLKREEIRNYFIVKKIDPISPYFR
jgi:hypothetical protein